MPQFNLDEYELVEDRIRRFYEDYPDGRIIAYELTSEEDRARGYWVVRAQIFESHEDQHSNCPKATGMAFEIEGGSGANRTSALENAETSAIGRALANADYAKGKRPSRTEMEKAARGPVPRTESKTVSDEFLTKIDATVSIEELNALWEEAVKGGFSEEIRSLFTKRKKALNG
jgi:hypothetical protein